MNSYYYQTYSTSFNNKAIKIYGSDLKFIDYGVFTPICNSHTTDNFDLSNDGYKYQIKVNNECTPTFNLYIVKNDNSDFINLCNIYYKKDIIFETEFFFAYGKERILQFELDSNLDNGIYKVVLIAEKDSMLFKYKAQFININKKSSSLIIIIILCPIIVLIIIAFILYIIYIKKRNNNSYDKNKIEEEMNKPNYITDGFDTENSPAPICQ